VHASGESGGTLLLTLADRTLKFTPTYGITSGEFTIKASDSHDAVSEPSKVSLTFSKLGRVVGGGTWPLCTLAVAQRPLCSRVARTGMSCIRGPSGNRQQAAFRKRPANSRHSN
jgi:hypothetical protein